MPHTQANGFYFAIGLSSAHNFENLTPFKSIQNATVALNYGKWLSDLTENDGNVNTQTQVNMKTCTEEDWANFYPFNEEQRPMIEKHKNFGQFFCPQFGAVNGTEISIFNQFDAVHHKVANIYLTTCLLN